MSADSILCLGGTLHGVWVPMPQLTHHFVNEVASHTQMRTDILANHKEKIHPAVTEEFYEIKRTHQTAFNPRRTREFEWGQAASYSLTDRDRRAISMHQQTLPWAVSPADMFDDFDQWFAHSVWRHHDGRLFWHDRFIDSGDDFMVTYYVPPPSAIDDIFQKLFERTN